MARWLDELKGHPELARMIAVDWLDHKSLPLVDHILQQSDFDFSWRCYARECWQETAE